MYSVASDFKRTCTKHASFLAMIWVYVLYCTYYAKKFNVKDICEKLFVFLGGSYLMSNLMQRRINHLQEDFLSVVTKYTGAYTTHIDTRKHIDTVVARMSSLPHTDQKIVRYNVKETRYFLRHSEDASEVMEKNLFQYCKQCMCMDLRRKVLTVQEAELQTLISFYHESTQEQLCKLVTDIIISSHSSCDKADKITAFLHGIPGVGKTHFVESLCEIFQLPIVHVKGKQLRESYKFLSEYFTNNSYENVVIFVDEYDKIKGMEYRVNTLLSLCDSDTSTITACKDFDGDHLWYKFNISGIIVIISGNELPKTNALLNRTPIITFKDPERHVKVKAAKKYLQEYMCSYVPEYTVTDVDVDVINTIIDTDTYGGLRIVRDVIIAYARHVLQKRYIPASSFLSQDAFNVKDTYSMYEQYVLKKSNMEMDIAQECDSDNDE